MFFPLQKQEQQNQYYDDSVDYYQPQNSNNDNSNWRYYPTRAPYPLHPEEQQFQTPRYRGIPRYIAPRQQRGYPTIR